MRFPNAYDGIKKIFVAEMLVLILFAIIMVAFLTMIIGVRNGSITSIYDTFTVLLIMAAAGIIAIVGLIFQIHGTALATKDEAYFMMALKLAIVAIALAVVRNFLGDSNVTVNNILGFLPGAIRILITYYIINGIISLADKTENSRVSEISRKARLKIIIGQIIFYVFQGVSSAIIINIPSSGFSGQGGNWVLTLVVVGLIVSIITYVIYLKVLSQAKKMLADSSNIAIEE